MDFKEQSLRRALQACACFELPRVFVENGVDFWLEAIACVRKRDGSYGYCRVEHRADGKVEYKEDFGSCSPIYALMSVHPYKMLDRSKYEFRGPDETFARILVSEGLIPEGAELTHEELAEWRITLAIEQQMLADKEYQNTGIREPDVELDEDGFVPIQSAEVTKNADVIIAEDGSEETFVDSGLSSPLKGVRRGRKAKK